MDRHEPLGDELLQERVAAQVAAPTAEDDRVLAALVDVRALGGDLDHSRVAGEGLDQRVGVGGVRRGPLVAAPEQLDARRVEHDADVLEPHRLRAQRGRERGERVLDAPAADQELAEVPIDPLEDADRGGGVERGERRVGAHRPPARRSDSETTAVWGGDQVQTPSSSPGRMRRR